jgi:hypothetical protein
MRKITKQARNAFHSRINFKSGNTEIKNFGEGTTKLFLHSNNIATIDAKGNLFFCMCSWASPTTRERLNAALISIGQRKGKQYFINPDNTEIEICPSTTYHVDKAGFLTID